MIAPPKTPTSEGSAEKPPSPRRRRRWRLAAWLLAACFLLAAVLAAAAPALLSTGPGLRFLLSVINSGNAGRVAIESLALRWGAGQRATGIAIFAADGKRIVEIGEATTGAGLWQLLFRGNAAFGSTAISDLRAELVFDDEGESNLLAALSPPGERKKRKRSKEPVRVPRSLAFGAVVRNASIAISASNVDPVEFTGVGLRATLAGIAEPLRFECEGQSRQGSLAGAFEAKGEIRDAFDAAGNLAAGAASGEIDAATSNIPTGALDALLALDGLLAELLGGDIDATIKAKLTPGAREVDVAVTTPNLEARLRGNDAQGAFSLSGPCRAFLTLTPECAERLFARGGAAERAPKLAAALPLECTLSELRVPLPYAGAASIAAKFEVTALRDARFELPAARAGGGAASEVVIRGLRAYAMTGGDEPGIVTAALQATVEPCAETGAIAIDASARRAIGANSAPVDFDVTLVSERLNGKLAARLDRDSVLALAAPARFDIVLTPELAARLANVAAAEIPLDEPAAVAVTLRELRIPLAPFSPARCGAAAEAAAARIALRTKEPKRRALLYDVKLAATADGSGGAVRFDFGARAEPAAGATPAAQHIAAQGTIGDLFGANGALRRDAFTLSARAALAALPAARLDGWIGGEPLAEALLGAEVNLTATGEFQVVTGSGGGGGGGGAMAGAVAIDFAATHARGKLRGKIADGTLTIAEPIAAEVDATKELGAKLLAKLSPILKGVHGEKPIRLEVAADGFSLPLRDLSLRALNAPEVRIDIGRVTIENDVVMESLLALAKRESRAEMPAWFSPLVIEVRDGRAAFTRRLDLLIDDGLHLATWGSVDLADFAYAETLALPATALAKVFRLKHLEADDIYLIPVRGTSRKPQIDFRRALADVAALQAKDRGITELLEEAARIKNPFARALVEGQLKEAARFLGEYVRRGEKPPPPSVEILPWAEK
ncbi:MAG: hypothetical protein L0Z55_05665 [Planctomycetes bacterium]|nr:hypothetical protein [Planctomycetota bacterium]